MKKCVFVLAVVAIAFQATSLYASCPGDSDLTYIFCDDFDSYCVDGGLPGTPNCSGTSGKSNALLQSVWFNTSPATLFIIDDNKSTILYDVYSAQSDSKFEDGPMGQQTVRDWIASPSPVTPDNMNEQVLDFHRRIGLIHGSEYAAVIGSEASPLTLSFAIGAATGKLWTSSAYMELAFGTHTDPMNMANTDYGKWPKTPCCNGLVNNGPWPILCAQGNPVGGGIPVDAGCPAVGTTPPPVRNAIAVGSLPILDTDPCHCGPYNHNPQAYNLAFYDGQLWWTLKTGVASLFPGATQSGTRTPLGNAPATPPANYPEGAQPGNFYLSSPTVDTTVPKPAGKNNYPVYRSYNTVTLSIKRDTLRIELTSVIPCSEPDPSNPSVGLYYNYVVTSVLDNVPLKYAGPFDRLRVGVGPGCELASDTNWSACTPINGRAGLLSPGGYQTSFDRVELYGGVGYSIKGACCDAADGACTQELQADCITHGRWTKSSQTCEETLCCPLVYGDDNKDGSVDMDDFGVLQRCITTGGGVMNPACRCFDFDGSNSITASDVQHFADCAVGPGVPGNGTGDCKGRGW